MKILLGVLGSASAVEWRGWRLDARNAMDKEYVYGEYVYGWGSIEKVSINDKHMTRAFKIIVR